MLDSLHLVVVVFIMIRMIKGVIGEITDHPLVGDHVCNVGNDVVSSAAAAAAVSGGGGEEEPG